MARNMTTQISHTVPPGDLARSGLTGVARHLLSVSVIALLFGLSPAAAQFRIDRNTEASEESSGVIQGTVGYLADTTTATGGDNLGDHVATMPLNMSGFSISGIATPDGTDPGAGVNVQYVDDMFGAYTPPEQDLSNYVTKSGMPQTITSAKTFDGPVLFSDDVQVTKVPASTRDVTNKAYVDDAVDDLVTLTTNQSVSGDKSFTGSVAVRTPTGDMGAANKLYVDNAISVAGGSYVTMGTNQIIGGTPITGAKGFTDAVTFGGEVNVTSAPDDANDAANKAYVDSLTDGLAGRVTVLEGDVTALTASVTTLQGDVSTLDTRVTNLANRTITAGSGITASGTLGGGITVAVDPTVVRTSGNQTLAGVKNFSSLPTVPTAAPTLAGQVASKAYVDAQVAGAVGTTYAAGDGLSLAGTTFAVNGTVVRTTGDQTLAGVKTFSAPIAGSITGNAATATELQTARTINGVAFDGGANITLPTVNTTGAQTVAGVKTFSSPIAGSITGNAATASELQTARTINGVAFDGGANITLPTVNTTGAQAVAGVKTFSDIPVIPTTAPTVAGQVASKAYVDAQVAGAVGTTYTAGSGLSLTGTTFAADGTVVRTSGDQTLAGVKTFSAPIAGSITGNAATATKLASARTINGVAFDGTAGITLPTVNTTGAQAVAGVKTFSDIPILPVTAPTSDLQAVNKAYADTKFGIGSVLSTTDDFDDVLMSGYHKATTGISTAAALALNRPSGQPGMLEVLNNGGSIMQRYSTINSTGTFYRTRNSSGVWFAWKPFASYNAGDGIDLDVTTQTFAVDATVVRTTGTQSIAGTKTFSGALTATGTVNLSTTSYVPTMGTTSTALVNKGYVDGGFVDLTTAETIGGTKTFSAIPVIPTTAPTAAGQVASKAYVDSKVGATYTAGDGLSLTGTDFAVDGTVVRTAGAQTLAGVKTFMSPIAGSITGNAATATKLAAAANINGVAFDGSAAITLPTVNTSGAQAVAGLKTFSTIPQIPTSTPTLAAEVASKGYVDSKIVAASSYAAGSGLALSGNVFSADNTVVRTSGAQTLSGVKTFNDLPLLPAATPTLDNQVASKAYADTKFGAGAALTTTDDFNTVVDTNFYKVSTGIATAAAIALNRPSGQPGILEVVNNGNVLVQRYSTLGAKGTFYRTRTSAGTWASWASVADYGAGDGLTLDAATNDFAVDDTVIRDSGAQSIAGTKTFTGTLTGTGTVNLPAATYVPTMGTTSTAVANKAYADTKVSMTGNQAISGVKSFAAFPTVPVATDPTADNQVVSKKYADSLALNITRSLMLPYFNILVRATDSLASTGTARHDKITIAAVPVDMKRVVCFTLTRNSSFVGDDSFEKEECYIVQEGDVIEVKSSSFGAVVIAINNEDQVNDFSFPSRTKISGPFLFIDEQSPASTPFIYNFSGYSNHEGSSQLSTSISVREYLMPNVSP